MPRAVLAHETDWAGWRAAARAFVLAGIEPADVEWSVGGNGGPLPESSGGFALPRALVAMASVAFQARSDERFGLPTVKDILRELEKPGRDPRPEFRTATFREGVNELKDLQPDMVLEGLHYFNVIGIMVMLISFAGYYFYLLEKTAAALRETFDVVDLLRFKTVATHQ